MDWKEKYKRFLMQKNGMFYVYGTLILAAIMNNLFSFVLIYIALFIWMSFLYFSIKGTEDKKVQRIYKGIMIVPIFCFVFYTAVILVPFFMQFFK